MKKHGNKGFTLIELLIVIGIMGIIAAMAAPTFATWRENLQYRQVGSALVALIREAKSTAISSNRQQRIEIDFANNTYQHQEGDRAANSANWLPSTRNPSLIQLPVGFADIQTRPPALPVLSINQLQFNPNGTMSYANTGVVMLAVSTQVFIRDVRPAAPVDKYRIDLTQTGRITGPIKIN